MSEAVQKGRFGGHPRGLSILFFAELWERFCHYGMRALLVLYMTKGFLYSDERAFGVYGSYMALVYCTPIVGGLLADRILGYRWAIILGGLLMAIGEFGLLIQSEFFFYAGMAFIVVGNGLFKPNISTLVGKLYPEGDPRRDSGFTLFYMGINIGAFSSTLICGYIGENFGWSYGFGLAGIGMLLGLFVFSGGRAALEGHGDPPPRPTLKRDTGLVILGCAAVIPVMAFLLRDHDMVGYLLLTTAALVYGSLFVFALRSEVVVRHRMFVILVLIFFHMVFWSLFEQAGSSLTLFADRNVDRDIFGWEFPATWGQSFNPLFIMLFAPVFAVMWPKLDAIGKNPPIPYKFVLGVLQVGLGFAMLVLGATFAGADGLSPLAFLAFAYLLHTTGELCLSPVGLSMVTKLAPQHITGMVMGAWFLSISLGHYIAAAIAALTGGAGSQAGDNSASDTLSIYTNVFGQITVGAIVTAAVLLVLSPLLKRWLHGVR